MAKHDYSDGGYLYIRAYNRYVPGVVGTDIKLSFKQKILILFCTGISVCVGNIFKEEGAEDGNNV